MQAPQLDVSQPTCVPVRPRLSRSAWTSSRRGSTSRWCSTPLTLRRTGTVVAHASPPGFGSFGATLLLEHRRVKSQLLWFLHRITMECDTADHERDAGDVAGARHLCRARRGRRPSRSPAAARPSASTWPCCRRAIASWSVTYGITDERDRRRPTPASSASGSVSAGIDLPGAASGRHGDRRDQHRGGESVDAAITPDRSRTGARARCSPRTAPRWRTRTRTRAARVASCDPGQQVDAGGTASASAAALRRVRAPIAASAITGRNSIAATVASGSRSIAS